MKYSREKRIDVRMSENGNKKVFTEKQKLSDYGERERERERETNKTEQEDSRVQSSEFRVRSVAAALSGPVLGGRFDL